MADFNPAQSFSQGHLGGQRILASQRNNQINALQQSVSQQLGQGGFNPGESAEFQQLSGLAPQVGAQILSTFNSLEDPRKKAIFEDARKSLQFLEAGNIEGFMSLATNRSENVVRLGGDPSGVDGVINMVNSGDIQGAISQLKQTELTGMQATDSKGNPFLTDPLDREIKRAQAARGGKSAKMLEIESLIKIAEADPKAETIRGKAAHIELGLIAKVSKTAAERIAENEQLANSIVQVESDKASAREGAKLKQQLIHKPKITTAVKEAEKLAIERGDVLNSLSRSHAALPGLNVAVSELKELAQISTSTFGGKLFDAAVKQSGFGATKGATARAKFIAIVNNQVLPLLKETFGAAFTFQEGESLKATMGDPDASAEEKMVQLDAFIAQKMRDIETKQRQLSQPAATQPSSVGRFTIEVQ